MMCKRLDRVSLALLMVILVTPFILNSIGFAKVSTMEEVNIFDNQACLECHRDEKLFGFARDGNLVSVGVNEEGWSYDVHNRHGIRCVQCHLEARPGVHPKEGFKKVNCVMDCHTKGFRNHVKEYEQCQKGAHAVGIKNEEGKVIYCCDCHGKHNIRSEEDPLSLINKDNIASTCTRCHEDVVKPRGILNQIISYRVDHHEKVNPSERNDESQCLNCHYKVVAHSRENQEKHSCEKCHSIKQYQQSLWFSPIHLNMSYKEQPTTFIVKLIYILFIIAVAVCVVSYIVFSLIKILRSEERIQEWMDRFPWLFEKREG